MNSSNLIESLHGLRGLAVLYVVASHLGNTGLPLLPIPLNAIGKVGVWIFFGLSAFLLTSKLREQWVKSPSAATVGIYLTQRVFRIYPLFTVVLILHVLHGNMDWTKALKHLILIEGQGELWAIPTEFQFYLLLPLIAVLPRRVAAIVLSLALAGCFAYGVLNPTEVFSNGISIIPKAAPFALAGLFAMYRPDIRKPSALAAAGFCVLVACTWFYRYLHVERMIEWTTPWLSLTLGVAVTCLIASALERGPTASALSNKYLVRIGEISFSIYLLHMFVIVPISKLQLPPYAGAWIALFLSLIVAELSYRFIEAPGIRIGRNISARLRSKANTPLEP